MSRINPITRKPYKFCKGNIKLGNMWTWSTLYGDEPIYVKTIRAYMVGTCGKHCAGCKHACYVRKSYRYGSVIQNHAKNTFGLREEIAQVYADLHNQLKSARKKPDTIRINQSGELENAEQFDLFVRLAHEFPDINFYLYTKAYEIVTPALLAGSVPANFTILFSVWTNQGVKEFDLVKMLDNVKAFVYMENGESNPGCRENTLCAAYDHNGKLNHAITCDKCRKCFNRLNSCKVIGTMPH